MIYVIIKFLIKLLNKNKKELKLKINMKKKEEKKIIRMIE